MKRRFLIDENTSPALADQLRRHRPELEVISVGDDIAPPKGTLDPEILMWIENNNYTLITRNRKSMPDHFKHHLSMGHHIQGILTLRPKASMGEIIEYLLLIWELVDINEYKDQIVHIPL
jgi:predicted nuclease of predicted toxin-antitoxin system